MHEYDDFPISSSGPADTGALYSAFLEAGKLLREVPAVAQSDNRDQELHQLTSYLYARRKSEALFRANASASAALAEVWLSRVTLLAEWYSAAVEVPQFKGLAAEDLTRLSRLSAQPAGIRELPRALEECGIILVHEAAIPGAKLDGAVFLLESGTPVIGLSLRYARLDYYWFTLMHELAHVVLHQDKLRSPIVEDLDEEFESLIEMEANRLARDALIPRHVWRNCTAKYTLREDDVRDLAQSLNIAPQIVAGRLRKETRRHDLFSSLIHAVDVRGVIRDGQ